ncbi:uncharacterized protein Dvar_54600 [Desulfosarcina variabilis str. Montpellier]|uniref:hypothetical protein n=1 Tax=Desulfosarcina variabilis TaxID=2300 RepID=UPI003AFB0D35
MAVYIRHISIDTSRGHAIEQLAEQTRRSGCDLILAKTSLVMARHAHTHGFINFTYLIIAVTNTFSGCISHRHVSHVVFLSFVFWLCHKWGWRCFRRF